MILMSYFFYRNVFAMIPMIAVGVLFYRRQRSRRIRKNREVLEKQFKECILGVGTLLRAGYAVENAFRESEGDMVRMFGADSLIVNEIDMLRRGLVMNIPLEELLKDLAFRSGSPHIDQFAQVFEIAKKSGGNMAEIIRSSAEMIGRDIDARSEMETVISGRRMEQNIMKIVPFAIVMYIDFSNRGYFAGLYGNLRGAAIMTGCLAVYIAAYFIGDRILEKLEKQV